MAVDFKTALGTGTGNASCTSKSLWCSSIACEHFTHLCGTTLPGHCHPQLQIWVLYTDCFTARKNSCWDASLTVLMMFHTPPCQPINCILEDAPIAKMIELSGRFLPSSSPAVLGPDEWLKYQCGEGHTLSGIPDSSDLFTVRCPGGDHTMTHCKSVQCGDPQVIACAMPQGDCCVTHHLRKACRVPVRSWLSCGCGAQVSVEARRLPR